MHPSWWYIGYVIGYDLDFCGTRGNPFQRRKAKVCPDIVTEFSLFHITVYQAISRDSTVCLLHDDSITKGAVLEVKGQGSRGPGAL